MLLLSRANPTLKTRLALLHATALRLQLQGRFVLLASKRKAAAA